MCQCQTLNFVSFFKVLIILNLFNFYVNFKISLSKSLQKNACQDFGRAFVETRDQFGKTENNTEFPTQEQGVSAFTSVLFNFTRQYFIVLCVSLSYLLLDLPLSFPVFWYRCRQQCLSFLIFESSLLVCRHNSCILILYSES